MKITLRTVVLTLLALFALQGCIPPNEHVGAPAPHSYTDGAMGGYYYDGYYGYRGHYYR